MRTQATRALSGFPSCCSMVASTTPSLLLVRTTSNYVDRGLLICLFYTDITRFHPRLVRPPVPSRPDTVLINVGR